MSRRTALATAAAFLAAAAPALAADGEVTTMAGAPGPGPSTYDKVFVAKFGPASAKRVLVLEPGTSGGAGDFTLSAREIVKRVPGLQVWAVDRRSQALEDTSVFKQGLAGTMTPQQVQDYYLGWIGNDHGQPHYQPRDEKTLGFAREWGAAGRAQRPPPRRDRREEGRPLGAARRPLPRRVAGRGLRELGLRRACRLQGRRRPRAARRRPARLVLDSDRRAVAGADQEARGRVRRSSTSSASACRGPPACSPRRARWPR